MRGREFPSFSGIAVDALKAYLGAPWWWRALRDWFGIGEKYFRRRYLRLREARAREGWL